MANIENEALERLRRRANTQALPLLLDTVAKSWQVDVQENTGLFWVAPGVARDVEIIDLSTLTPGDTVYVTGDTRETAYTFIVNANSTLVAWRTNPDFPLQGRLIGRKDAVATFNPINEASQIVTSYAGFIYVDGIDQMEARLAMPDFSYYGDATTRTREQVVISAVRKIQVVKLQSSTIPLGRKRDSVSPVVSYRL